MPEDDQLAGMDPEGLRRTLGELLAANRKTQANLDKIRQQFPIQPDNLADSIPDYKELEDGGLILPEEGEPGEVIEVGKDGKPAWASSCCGDTGGAANLPFDLYEDIDGPGASDIVINITSPRKSIWVLLSAFQMQGEENPGGGAWGVHFGKADLKEANALTYGWRREAGGIDAASIEGLALCKKDNEAQYPSAASSLTITRPTALTQLGYLHVLVIVSEINFAKVGGNKKSGSAQLLTPFEPQTIKAPAETGYGLAIGHVAHGGQSSLPGLSHTAIYNKVVATDKKLTAGDALVAAQFEMAPNISFTPSWGFGSAKVAGAYGIGVRA